MMFSPVFLIFPLVYVVYSQNLPDCERRECARYKVIEKRDGYEVRRYEAHKIATISSKDTTYRRAKSGNFMPLFRYIQGANERMQKIKMTIPVFNKVQISTAGDEKKEQFFIEMAFVMPKKVKDPPKPTNDKITIKDFGPVTVFALSFDGWATEKRVFDKKEKLRLKLDADGVKYDDTMFYSAGYNSPWKLFNRLNDVFYVAKED